MKKQLLLRLMLIGGLFSGLSLVASQGWADDSAQLKGQIQALQERVDQLENQLANRQQSVGTTSASAALPVYDQWIDPFTQMMMIDQQMQRNMRRAFANPGMMNPRMDMKQTKDQYIITMDIPGMDKDKINVETKEGMLVISGERRSETENNKNNQFYRQERSFGSFMQAIPLPDDVKKDRIEATYKNGVLTVTVERVKKEEIRSGEQKIIIK